MMFVVVIWSRAKKVEDSENFFARQTILTPRIFCIHFLTYISKTASTTLLWDDRETALWNAARLPPSPLPHRLG